MHEYPIDDVHRLLDGLESLLTKLRGVGPERIRVDELPALIETIHELDGWRNTAYLQKKVGISGSRLNQFMTLRGTVSRRDAIKIADRLRTFLRAEDQASDQLVEDATLQPSTAAPQRFQDSPTVVVKSERWITVRTSNEIKMKIAAISSLLDTIIEQVSHANAPSEEQILTELDRQQLIAILETALNVLRSPIVETGLLKKAGEVLRKGAESAVEKQVQQGLGTIMHSAGDRILDLMRTLLGL